jgi:hydrogenase nickel incorporation protein HypA/HybF
MHEVSVALAIADQIAERVPGDGCKITAVHLRIGALTAVDVAALEFAWELATEGTPASGSQLKIDRIPLTIFCAPCAERRTVERGTLPVCPVCATPSGEILAGRELQITALEVLDDLAARGSSTEHSAQEQHAGA